MKFIGIFLLFQYFVGRKCSSDDVQYDRYSGKPLNATQLRELSEKNLTQACTISVRACAAHEDRRVDGTCNNPRRPARGAAGGPYLRLLPPEYGKNGTLRTSASGAPLPSARRVRTELQSTGIVADRRTFNMAAVHFLAFMAVDVSAVNGILDYVRERPHCCAAGGAADPRCIPMAVPENDPYLRSTGVRCLNFSRAETFQDVGCLDSSVRPEQINSQTPAMDLSHVYGGDAAAAGAVRGASGGLLRLQRRGGRSVPAGDAAGCTGNMPNETTCYRFGNPAIGNFDLRLATFTIFFMREHNRIAAKLKEINPCWKDDRLYKVARQINIATAVHMYMYELLPTLLGHGNMVSYGLISKEVEFVTSLDDKTDPLIFAEFAIAARYFHTLIDGKIKLYDKDYRYGGSFSVSDSIFRPALVEEGDNFESINRGTFRQRASRPDDVQDPEISEKFYGALFAAHDLPSSDLQRGRDLGVAGYARYRRFCGRPHAANFSDLLDVMDEEKVYALQRLYTHVDDVELLAGVWAEAHVPDAVVGPTLFCIMAKQLQVMRYSDRFWFERGDQRRSFNLEQLKEIRKTNMARFACDNAEGIEYIQPRAMLNVRAGNDPVPCAQIRAGADLTKWRDPSCGSSDDPFAPTTTPSPFVTTTRNPFVTTRNPFVTTRNPFVTTRRNPFETSLNPYFGTFV